MDTFSHIVNNKFKYQNENLVGFIPNTSSEILDTISTRQGNIFGAGAAAVIGGLNNVNQRNILTKENYYNGCFRYKTIQLHSCC